MSEERDYNVMKDLQGFMSESQIRSIYNSAENVRDKLLIAMLWRTGRRVGEILQLQVKDIDFENPAIVWHIEKKKRKLRGEKVKWDLRKRKPLDKFTFKLLNVYLNQEGLKSEAYVFHTPGNSLKPISRQRVFQIVRRLGEKAGVNRVGEKQIHPHHFRHSFAIAMAKKMDKAADLEKLRMMMEHANLGITQTYLQFSDEDLRGLVDRI